MSVPAQPAVRYSVPGVVCALDVMAKAVLVLLLLTVVVSPEVGNLEGKGATARAVGYPLLAFAIPALWFLRWRDRASFPWLADLLVTVTCFSDTLGNRLDLYDTIRSFDDWMHFVNTGLLAAAFVILTLPHGASLGAVLERSLAFGVTAALAWELAEYVAFLSASGAVDRYADTLGDLTLGMLGSLVGGMVVHRAWQAGYLRSAAPQIESRPAAALLSSPR
ncbi:hypothetical protein [Nocardioides sp. W7]|uniref:hypothetical protein n=1 Tax=Nocardioides sp. W7 TaxID=2931390 RepID=UPI001FD59FD5|nr:hypothetical protein [Nocardioides sp. W7]